MGKIIDFTDALKKKAQEKEGKEYYIRTKKCSENRKNFGRCNCKACLIKKQIAAEIIKIAHNKFNESSEQHDCNLYWGDFVDTLAFSIIIHTISSSNYNKP